jgi:hypothetical protein
MKRKVSKELIRILDRNLKGVQEPGLRKKLSEALKRLRARAV